MSPRAAKMLVTLLAMAHLLVTASAWTMLDRQLWPEPLFVVLLALAGSQVCLVAFWAGASRMPRPLRLAVMTTWCAFYGVHFGGYVREEVLMFFVQSVLIAGSMRWRPWRELAIVEVHQSIAAEGPGGRHETGPALRGMQFSLADLIWWVTVAAMLAAAPSWLAVAGRDLLAPLVVAAAFAAIGLAVMWAALGPAACASRLSVVGVGIWIVSWTVARLVPAIGESMPAFILLCELTALLVAGSLAILRLCAEAARCAPADCLEQSAGLPRGAPA